MRPRANRFRLIARVGGPVVVRGLRHERRLLYTNPARRQVTCMVQLVMVMLIATFGFSTELSRALIGVDCASARSMRRAPLGRTA